MRPVCRGMVFAAAAPMFAACAHVTNKPLCDGNDCQYDSGVQNTYRFSPKVDKNTLVIVTLSGGGARAAALAFGALQALGELEPVPQRTDDGAASLLDQIDIMSSVSGGSLTAGWYAIKGKDALMTSGSKDQTRLWDFLNKKWTGELVWKGLNPWSLARYTFFNYERNDVLSDFYSAHLFGELTYQSVLERYRSDPHQAFVILNATDLGHETVFPFTQGHFDLLCSDLNQYRLADAVAASSNFPLAFSPLGLENFSGCKAQNSNSWKLDGPPQWISHYDTFDDPKSAPPRSIQLNQVRTARTAKDLLSSPENHDQDRYLHLLDGGVTDNLGVRSTLAIEDDPARVPSLYLRLSGPKRPAGYENVQKVLYVVVNARTRDPAGVDAGKKPPGEIKTALRMTDTQLDSSTLTDQDYLIAELEATAYGTHATGAFLSMKPGSQSNLPAPDGRLRFYIVSVDFEMIPDKVCRDTAWKLKTNWSLEDHQAQDIVDLARAILKQSDDLKQFYGDLNMSPKFIEQGKPLRDVCNSLESHVK
jgi:NTE family protein